MLRCLVFCLIVNSCLHEKYFKHQNISFFWVLRAATLEDLAMERMKYTAVISCTITANRHTCAFNLSFWIPAPNLKIKLSAVQRAHALCKFCAIERADLVSHVQLGFVTWSVFYKFGAQSIAHTRINIVRIPSIFEDGYVKKASVGSKQRPSSKGAQWKGSQETAISVWSTEQSHSRLRAQAKQHPQTVHVCNWRWPHETYCEFAT